MDFQMTNVYRFIEETNGMTIPVQLTLSLFHCVNCFLIATKKEQFGVDDNKHILKSHQNIATSNLSMQSYKRWEL
jgi:hypothetical protein